MKALLMLVGFMAYLVPPDAFGSESIFEQLAGTWQGTGQVRGMNSEQSMVWEPVLGGQFLKLEFDNKMHHESGSVFHFQANGYYRAGPDGAISGNWFDSRGVKFPLKGKHTPTQMNIEWGTPDTELGRTEYRIVEGVLEVTDEVLGAEGHWRVFGRSSLERKVKNQEPAE